MGDQDHDMSISLQKTQRRNMGRLPYKNVQYGQEDDGFRWACSLYWHAKVQPIAVISYAVTVMDKIDGWTDEEKKGGFKICGVHVDLQQDGAYRAAEAHSRNAGVLEARDVIHYVVR